MRCSMCDRVHPGWWVVLDDGERCPDVHAEVVADVLVDDDLVDAIGPRQPALDDDVMHHPGRARRGRQERCLHPRRLRHRQPERHHERERLAYLREAIDRGPFPVVERRVVREHRRVGKVDRLRVVGDRPLGAARPGNRGRGETGRDAGEHPEHHPRTPPRTQVHARAHIHTAVSLPARPMAPANHTGGRRAGGQTGFVEGCQPPCSPRRRTRRTNAQNSLPSGSLMTHHRTSSSGGRSRVAPRRTSASMPSASATSTSRCTRFFTVFGSGTTVNHTVGPSPSGGSSATSGSSSGPRCRGHAGERGRRRCRGGPSSRASRPTIARATRHRRNRNTRPAALLASSLPSSSTAASRPRRSGHARSSLHPMS